MDGTTRTAGTTGTGEERMGLVEATAILMRMMGKAGVTVDEVRALRVGVGRILKRRVDYCKAWARKHAGEPLGGAVAREFAGLGSGGAEVLGGGTGVARTGAGLPDGDAAGVTGGEA